MRPDISQLRFGMMTSNDIRDKLALFTCTSCGTGTLAAEDECLLCSNCGTRFAIVRGVPRFVPGSSYADSFGLQWNIHARTQLDSFSGQPISRNRLFEATRWPSDLSGQTILEAGSGAGRFTEILISTGASVISCDLSSAVDANYQNNGGHANLLIIQASLLTLPIRPRSIDKVICLGVLQHTPNPEESFASLANRVCPGGELVIDVYAARLRSLISWKYLLRPITKRMSGKTLYSLIERVTPALLPISNLLYRMLGHVGLRLLPIVHYPELKLSPDLALQWAILDTFDMYSPAHDHPQTLAAVKRWFDAAGFTDIAVGYGLNGIVGRGRRPPMEAA